MPLQRICFAVAALMLTATTVMAGSHRKPKQAMFKTQAEAEAAAPGFGCTGAHQMGEMWWPASPCLSQTIHISPIW